MKFISKQAKEKSKTVNNNQEKYSDMLNMKALVGKRIFLWAN